ncbi:MAG: class I SAM-dependent methyltransferase [Dehalococcoidia bacterium]
MDDRDEQMRAMLATNRAVWDAVAEQFVGSTALPEYGPLTPTEDTLRLLPDLRGLRVLELGCGSGHSLLYLARHGAAELWALDFSPVQVANATTLLREHHVDARLVCSPMEENPGIPNGHFDLVVSVYALGWTVDLTRTLALVAGYLRPGGVLVFSWAHPVYQSLAYDAGRFVLQRSYSNEEPEPETNWRGGGPVV